MLKTLTISLFLVFLAHHLQAQISPAEGRELNYRIIGFSCPPTAQTKYTLEIAEGNVATENAFNANIINTVTASSNKIIAEVPAFGTEYTWRVIYEEGKPQTVVKSPFHHFRTGNNIKIDKNAFRLRVVKPNAKYREAYVFTNNRPVLYDMAGKPVWYLPNIEGRDGPVTDLKLSPKGTITFLADDEAYEVNYDGEVLWKARKSEREGAKSFHHELTRLSNGHYMVLGMEILPCTLNADSCVRILQTGEVVGDKPNAAQMQLQFGTLVEFDEQGKMVWIWKSSAYYGESDLVNRSVARVGPTADIHPNAFYFNEKDQTIYISCKNISRIIKIKYPSAQVLANYGEQYKYNSPAKEANLFSGQHGVKISKDGNILLLNNNSFLPGCPPTVEKLHEGAGKNGKLKKVWEYKCNVDLNDPAVAVGRAKKTFPVGGNVIELKDGSLLFSTPAPDNHICIVNAKKEIVWSSQPERFDPGGHIWQAQAQYRASIIETRQALENLIWNSNTGFRMLSAN